MTDLPEMTWRTDVKVAWPMKRLGHAQLGSVEGAMLYYLARDWYSGTGKIAELGSFLGASASLMAQGIKENPNWSGEKVMHCYDLWEAQFGNMADFIRDRIDPDFPDGGDFLPLFWDQVGEGRDTIEIHKGDFTHATWDGEPLEIVFVDISKTPELNKVCIEQFFAKMQTGGLMVNQDFHNPGNIWVQVTMGPLMEYFTVLEPRADDSALFRLDKPLPADVVADAGLFTELDLGEKLARIDRTIAAFADDAFTERYVMLCKARVQSEAGQGAAALATLNEADARMGTEYEKRLDFFWERRLAHMRRLAEAAT